MEFAALRQYSVRNLLFIWRSWSLHYTFQLTKETQCKKSQCGILPQPFLNIFTIRRQLAQTWAFWLQHLKHCSTTPKGKFDLHHLNDYFNFFVCLSIGCPPFPSKSNVIIIFVLYPSTPKTTKTLLKTKMTSVTSLKEQGIESTERTLSTWTTMKH